MSESEPSYYSMRQLLPYQGTIQIVELPGFRALSADGYCWRVQISQSGSRYDTHGVWYPDKPGSFIKTPQTESFIAALQHLPALPFPMVDSLELWLLDGKRHLPLALLSSRLPGSAPPRLDQVNWSATYPGDYGFVAPSLITASHEPDGDTGYSHSEVLHRCIRARAGGLAKAQWFQRDNKGGGLGYLGCRIDDDLQGRKLDKAAFPELLLSEISWDSDRHQQLVKDYHHWQAANLLTHDNLTFSSRDRLERQACKHQVERLYALRHVLPQRINADLIDTAFVQAVIRKSASRD